MEPIKVLLVDNEEVFREGLAKLMNDQSHIDLVYHCSSRKEAIEEGLKSNPDVIIISSQISDGDSLETIKEMKKHSPGAKFAIITRPGEEFNPVNALKSGARAYLAKNISASDLVKSIELISSGRIIISPVFAEKFITEIASAEKDDKTKALEPRSELSEREMEIVKLIAQGNTNKEIAQKLYIAENTVKVHVKNILSKMELRNRQQLVTYAVLQNWVTAISPPDKSSLNIA
jgi:DNA-binding NarL/FixJ family response regulator